MRTLTRWSVSVVAAVALSFGFLAPTAEADPTGPSPTASAALASAPWKARSNWGLLLEQTRNRFGLQSWPSNYRGAIDSGDYQCGPTTFDTYIDQQLAGLSDDQLDFLFTSGVLDFPALEALAFETSSDPSYALDEQATKLAHTFRDLRRFWDIESSDIQLLAMHGDMLRDPERVSRVLVALYGLPPAEAAGYADAVASIVGSVPEFDNGDNPIFTLNAFAFSGEGDPDALVAAIPDKIVYGDGFIDALEWMGTGDVGSRVVLAHEFGHHVQFELNLFDSPLTGAEATRRTELMADAYATYFAVHARGLSLNAKRVLATQRTFYEIGDCAITDPGHHGTPNQRMGAATWAANLAAGARPQGRILPAATFATLFDAELPELVAPDS